MKIAIFGLGYVGVVSAACLSRDGHTVVGVDPMASKARDVAAGLSPIREPGVGELLRQSHATGRLTAFTEPAAGVDGVDIVWICVGTPSASSGDVALDHVEACVRDIGCALREGRGRPLVVLRSTVPPGTTERVAIRLLEETSGLAVGHDIQVVFHPEFLREGNAVADFDDPGKLVYGEVVPGAAAPLEELYAHCKAQRFFLSLAEAELAKYCDNLFHALKITFANEIGALARAAGVDARRVADVYCSDHKSNISERYLRPGFAFGGSCLPKDLRAMHRFATIAGVDIPMLSGILESNAWQVDKLVVRIMDAAVERVGVVGLSFKAGTDDLRESPYVAVVKRLLGEGIRVRVWDEGVNPAALIGSNQAAARAALGHLEDLLVESPRDLDDADLILLNHATVDAQSVRAWLAVGKRVIDLVGVKGIDRGEEGYEGIAW